MFGANRHSTIMHGGSSTVGGGSNTMKYGSTVAIKMIEKAKSIGRVEIPKKLYN